MFSNLRFCHNGTDGTTVGWRPTFFLRLLQSFYLPLIFIVATLLYVSTATANGDVNSIYGGVESTCHPSKSPAQHVSTVGVTWCQHQNSFASLQQFIFDHDFLEREASHLFKLFYGSDRVNEDDGLPYRCFNATTNNGFHEMDHRSDLCQSVVAMRTSSMPMTMTRSRSKRTRNRRSENDDDLAKEKKNKENDINNMSHPLLSDNYLSFALITGEIALVNTRLKIPIMLRSRFPTDTDYERVVQFYDMSPVTSSMASVVQQQARRSSNITSASITYLETISYSNEATKEDDDDDNTEDDEKLHVGQYVTKRYYFDNHTQVLDMRVIDPHVTGELSTRYVSINLVQTMRYNDGNHRSKTKTAEVLFLSFDAAKSTEIELVSRWTIRYDSDDEPYVTDDHHRRAQTKRRAHGANIGMVPFVHWTNLNPRGPTYFDESQQLRYDHSVRGKRSIHVALYTSKLVTILEWDENVKEMEIDLTERFLKRDQSVEDLSTISRSRPPIFYHVSNSAHRVISAVSVEVDPIRRPDMLSIDTNCDNVHYQSALSVYLNVVEYGDPEEQSTLFVQHLPNFPLLPTIGTQGSVTLKGRVTMVRSAHKDIYHHTQSIRSDPYTADGYLNATVVCESFREYQYAHNVTSPLHSNKLSYEDCMDQVSQRVKCEVNLLTMGPEFYEYLNSFYYLHWQESIYLVDQSNHLISIVVKTPRYNVGANAAEFTLSLSNVVQVPGKINDLHVSNNDQHLFTSFLKQRWEIESMSRYLEVCDHLRTDPDNVFLKPFSAYCNSFQPKNVSALDFALTTSACANNYLCSRFDQPIVSIPDPGSFMYRSFIQAECPAGTYCPGDGRLHACPIGLICPTSGLIKPIPCSLPQPLASTNGLQPLQRTCYANNLDREMITPMGTWAQTSILPPVLIPPGKFLLKVRKNNGQLFLAGMHNCQLGDYCGLGREIVTDEERHPQLHYDELLCPSQTYCTNSSVITPNICLTPESTSMPYCPPGTINNQKCPSGYYCPNPNEKYVCSETQYCPEGSFMALPCPSGFYCPDPKQKIECPKKHYCLTGSKKPVRCTLFLSHCPKGSSKDSLTATGVATVLFIVVSIGFMYCLYLVYLWYHRWSGDRYRTQRRNATLTGKNNASETDGLLVVQVPQYQTLKEDRPAIELHKTDFTIELKFEELGLRLKSNKKVVLQGVNGEFEPGKLTAVMGVSGAGKSTCISALAGRAYYGKVLGKIYVNGELVDNLDRYSDRIGFVPQDDIMIRECTVEETLYFSARTRLNRRKSKSEIMDIVDNVIRVLRLDHVRHSVIGDENKRGISGGERKRVSVGIELVAQPIILFCDEPTSGLDSASSKEVCEALQSIAKSGITVIAVIHQPRYECFELFETLLLLGKEGRTAYMGPVCKVQSYFESLGYEFPPHVNPADYLMDITSGMVRAARSATTALKKKHIGREVPLPVHVDDLADIWKELGAQQVRRSEDKSPTKENANEAKTYPVQVYHQVNYAYLYQFVMCFERSITQQLRCVLSIFLDLFLVSLTGLFVGLLFLGDKFKGPVPPEIYNQCPPELREGCKNPVSNPIAGLSNTIGMGMALCSIMASLRVFGREKTVYRKESQTGLSTALYFWAKDMSMIPHLIIAPLIFSSIFYSIMGPRAPAIEYFYTIFLTYWSCFGLGYIISIVVAPHIAQLAAVVAIFILNIFSGISPRLPVFEDMRFPLSVMPYLSILRYSMELLYINELWMYKKVYDVSRALRVFGYAFSNHTFCWLMLIVLGFAFRIVACCLLLLSKPNNPMYRQMDKLTNWDEYRGGWQSFKRTLGGFMHDIRYHFSSEE